RGTVQALDPTAADSVDAQRLPLLLFDRLVALDGTPSLAVSWVAEDNQRRWRFRIRPGVRLHDGVALTPQLAAAALQPALPGYTVTADAAGVVIQSPRPAPRLPQELSSPRASVAVRLPNGTLQGSGPFRAMEWQPGKALTVAAFDGYWGGRPYLDSITMLLGRPLRDQLADFESGRASVAEVTPAEFRRQEMRGRRTWSSAAVDLVALVFLRNRPAAQDARVRQAMSLAIDRAPVWSVLFQKQGEPTGSLLPGWLTGWGFVFPARHDPAKAKEVGAGGPALLLGHDPADFVLKTVAERIVLNARESGLSVRMAAGAESDVLLVRVPASSTEPGRVLADYCRTFNTPAPASPTPEALYEAEHRLLEGQWILPLFHLPALYAIQPQVRNWTPGGQLHWRLDEVWLEGAP
ncbi:MAG: ABC transporter substrate-binding protein, partial [Acidobacteria bacterium]|nr:ABC transporter substrate-binding protein [Acidobacteriota bacterium]